MNVEAIVVIILGLVLSILFTFFPEEAVKRNTKIPIQVKRGESKLKNEAKLLYRVFGVFLFIVTFVVIVVFIMDTFY